MTSLDIPYSGLARKTNYVIQSQSQSQPEATYPKFRLVQNPPPPPDVGEFHKLNNFN